MKATNTSIIKPIVIKITLLLCLLILQQQLFSAPAKDLQLDRNMQLAMRDLTRDNAALLKASEGNYKTPLVNAKETVFPSNCLTWNTSQINEKARKHHKIINKYGKQHRIDVNLIKSIITAESCFKTKALSDAGAQGLMQLIPDTAARFGVKDSYDPKSNIRGGVRYLRFLLDRYKGNLEKTIAAYNAGEGKVDQYKGIPPYKETKQYVKNVLRIYQMISPNFINRNRVKAVYYPPSQGQKPGRQGWQYNRSLAPQLYKKNTQ